MKNCDVHMALSVLYYLILVDGQSQEHELQLFEQLGEQFDAAEFKACRETVIADCEKQVAGAADDFEHYELVAEGVDKTLARKPAAKGPQIPLSMVLWDMLAVAHADRTCSTEEERLIKHVVRVNKVDQRLYRQFVYTMNACVTVGVQLEAVENSSMSYSEAKPIVDELEHQRDVMVAGALDVINDSRMPAVPAAQQVQEDIVDQGMRGVGDFMNGAGQAIGDAAGKAGNAIGDAAGKAGHAIADAAGQVGNAMGAVGNEVQKGATQAWNNVANTVGGWFKKN